MFSALANPDCWPSANGRVDDVAFGMVPILDGPMQNRSSLDVAHYPLIGAMAVADRPCDAFDHVSISVSVASPHIGPHIPTRHDRRVLMAPEDMKVRLPHVIRHLARRLSDLVGPANAEATAAQLLAVVALSVANEADRISLLNTLCVRVPTRLIQCVVTAASGKRTESITIDDYFLGPFDSEKFVYATTRAGSSGWQSLARQCRGNFAITRTSDFVTLPLCITTLHCSQEDQEFVHGLVDSIYASVADGMWIHFWEGLRDAQLLEAALRTAYLDIDSFRASAVNLGANLWTIFSRIGDTSSGWVSPKGASLEISFPQPAAFEQLRGIVRAGLGFSGWIDSEVSKTLKAFCKMLWRASGHKQSRFLGASERLDDAFLHHMIALEMLFNEKTATTVAIVRRTAAATHVALGRQYAALKEEVDKLYDARSRFVHQGESVTEEQLGAASKLTAAATEWLLLLSSSQPSLKWTSLLKDLDLLAATLEAGKSASTELVDALAISATSKIPADLLSKSA